jgi:type II secretory pathway component PulM
VKHAAVAAAFLALAGVAVVVLQLHPAREATEQALSTLDRLRDEHRETRAEIARLQLARRAAPPTADPVAVRARVLAAIQALALRDTRLSVAEAGGRVRLSGRADFETALLLPERLVKSAGLVLSDVRYDADDRGLRFEVSARSAEGRP